MPLLSSLRLPDELVMEAKDVSESLERRRGCGLLGLALKGEKERTVADMLSSRFRMRLATGE